MTPLEPPLTLEPLYLKSPKWKAGVLPAPANLPQSERLRIGVADWVRAESAEAPWIRELFLQVWRLGAAPAGKSYGEHVQTWLPVRGIGIWPGRRPPQRMTEEIAMDCAAAGLAGEEPPLASHPLAQVSAGSAAVEHASATFLGNGMTVSLWFTTAAHQGWADRSQAVFQPTVQDPLFSRERFYAPLLDREILESATEEQLDLWTLGASAYMREDPATKSILFLSRAAV